LPHGTETILVVEDEPMVRALMVDMLRRTGYTVLEALQADEALKLVDEHGGPIHLLLTDVVMPRMSGPALAKEVLRRRPETAVLFISGYTDDAVIRHGVMEQEVELLQKPFGMRDLAERVRRLLDRQQANEGRGVILLIDDEPGYRETLAEVLRAQGYLVLTASDGSEGLALMRQEPRPGLVLFDLVMRGMNGWVFRQEQRKDPRLRDIPAVVISGQADPDAAAGFLEVAASFRKPVDVPGLLRVVRQYLPSRQE
jgi:CheY-like chemotaxis protein